MTRLSPLAALLLGSVALAGPIPEDSPDHAYHYASSPLTAGAVTLTATTAWARQAELKLKVAIDNADPDAWLMLRRDGITVTSGDRPHKPITQDNQYEIIRPTDHGAYQFVIPDPLLTMHHKEMSVAVTGASSVAYPATPIEAADGTLPVRSAKFNAGPFECVVKGKIKQSTDLTNATWRCLYRGKPGMIGFADEALLRVAIPAGEFGNESTGKVEPLRPGDGVNINLKITVIQPKPHGVDMQKSELTVKWDKVFSESPMVPVAFEPWAFTLDEALTAEKNN